MAVITGKRLMSVDAVGTLVVGPVRLRAVRWTGATTAGHVATLTDGADEKIWTSVASGANFIDESDLLSKYPDGVEGLKLTVLGSGVLDIYHG